MGSFIESVQSSWKLFWEKHCHSTDEKKKKIYHALRLFISLVQVLLEIVGIRNLPASEKGNVFVSFSKKKPDMFLNGSSHLSIFSETGEKKAAGFECEPAGELVLNVLTKSKPAKTIGTMSISLEELMDPNTKLSVEKWFELKLHDRQADSKPIYLHVAASFTVPVPSPHLFEMLKLHPFSMNACGLPVPGIAQHMRSWAHFVDGCGNNMISLQMRYDCLINLQIESFNLSL